VTRSLVIGPEASTHIVGAFLWYEEQRENLGWEFNTELHAVLGLLEQVPEAGPLVYRGLRRVLMRKFPYGVYYTLSPDRIEIRAVIHNRRHPKHWRARA
jgi:plasmid stabilization system protein ParE